MSNDVERAELNKHILALEELAQAINSSLCDSGTGGCRIRVASARATQAIELCLRMLRKHRKSIARL